MRTIHPGEESRKRGAPLLQSPITSRQARLRGLHLASEVDRFTSKGQRHSTQPSPGARLPPPDREGHTDTRKAKTPTSGTAASLDSEATVPSQLSMNRPDEIPSETPPQPACCPGWGGAGECQKSFAVSIVESILTEIPEWCILYVIAVVIWRW